MKKNIISILALVLALASLGLSAVCYMAVREEPTYYSDRLFELNRENEELHARIDTLTARLDQLQTMASLSSWSLDVAPWPDGTGADVTLTAELTQQQQGVSATLLVLLEGQPVANVPCALDGTVFTGTAELNAVDGYTYYCILTSPGGTQQLPLVGSDDPAQDIPGYLETSLSAYCNLVVSDWEEQEGGILVLTDAYAQVQLPRISQDGTIAIDTAELVLTLDGTETARLSISLVPSEVAGSFEQTITEARFSMPELDGEGILDLQLEVVLTDGRILTAYGASWYLDGAELASVVG